MNESMKKQMRVKLLKREPINNSILGIFYSSCASIQKMK
jgi:hypothetical protein